MTNKMYQALTKPTFHWAVVFVVAMATLAVSPLVAEPTRGLSSNEANWVVHENGVARPATPAERREARRKVRISLTQLAAAEAEQRDAEAQIGLIGTDAAPLDLTDARADLKRSAKELRATRTKLETTLASLN